MRSIDATRSLEAHDAPFAAEVLGHVARVLDEEYEELSLRTGGERAEFEALQNRLLSEGGN